MSSDTKTLGTVGKNRVLPQQFNSIFPLGLHDKKKSPKVCTSRQSTSTSPMLTLKFSISLPNPRKRTKSEPVKLRKPQIVPAGPQFSYDSHFLNRFSPQRQSSSSNSGDSYRQAFAIEDSLYSSVASPSVDKLVSIPPDWNSFETLSQRSSNSDSVKVERYRRQLNILDAELVSSFCLKQLICD